MARLFVSDVHLDAVAPQATEQFIQFLRTEAAGAQALYILGDLFEVWVGDDDPDAEKARIVSALRDLTASGVAGFVIHGNRDFLLGRGFCDRTGFRLLPDPVVMELNGERVLVTHGDALCTDDHSYQELRSTVRTADWQRRFLSLPFQVRDRFASQARAGSKAHNARMTPAIQDVNAAAVELAYRTARASRIIHGHTHRPGIHDTVVDGTPVQRIVLGAWYEEGSYLVYDNGRYELRTLPRHNVAGQAAHQHA
jgi:UDP-2,3-diacylglucosamine hydrolase